MDQTQREFERAYDVWMTRRKTFEEKIELIRRRLAKYFVQEGRLASLTSTTELYFVSDIRTPQDLDLVIEGQSQIIPLILGDGLYRLGDFPQDPSLTSPSPSSTDSSSTLSSPPPSLPTNDEPSQFAALDSASSEASGPPMGDGEGEKPGSPEEGSDSQEYDFVMPSAAASSSETTTAIVSQQESGYTAEDKKVFRQLADGLSILRMGLTMTTAYQLIDERLAVLPYRKLLEDATQLATRIKGWVAKASEEEILQLYQESLAVHASSQELILAAQQSVDEDIFNKLGEARGLIEGLVIPCGQERMQQSCLEHDSQGYLRLFVPPWLKVLKSTARDLFEHSKWMQRSLVFSDYFSKTLKQEWGQLEQAVQQLLLRKYKIALWFRATAINQCNLTAIQSEAAFAGLNLHGVAAQQVSGERATSGFSYSGIMY